MSETKPAQLTDLIGKTLISVKNYDNQEIIFTTNRNKVYKLWHCQHCCESVRVEDIVGDLEDLVGVPILMAEEVSSRDNPEGFDTSSTYQDSFTWTYYKFATIKGYVDIRWYGESNGYYSESVDFDEVT